MFTYKYPRPALTTDALLFLFDKSQNELSVLLIQRKNEPFKDNWALPGGFLDMDETAEQCVIRELKEETNVVFDNLQQLYTISTPDRDPRGRTISVVFWALIDEKIDVNAGDDAKNVKWFSVFKLPEMAFDHSQIINYAINELKNRVLNINCFKDFFSAFSDISDLQQLKILLQHS